MNLITDRIARALQLTHDLAAHLEEAHLSLALPDLPSNTIGEQFWCMVGARESYLNAIKNEKWIGFGCSLQDYASKPAVLATLANSQQAVMDFVTGTELSEIQNGFLLDLLEHEIQHHGQLIRYIYGNRLKFPQRWHERYTV